MQINKKVFTIAITALLLFSMLAIVAPAFAAVAAAAPVPATGAVGTKVGVVVSGASPGGQLQTYWENLAGAQLGNQTTYADGTGAATITVYIPYATAGVHSIIVKDVSTGATTGAGTGFTVTPKVTFSPASGIPGDSVVVNATGFTGTAGNTKIAANVTFIDGALTVTDVTPLAAQLLSATGDALITIAVPNLAYGPYAVNVEVNNTATVPNAGNLFATAATGFTIGAAITLSPTSGPPGTVVTVTGRGLNHAVHDVALWISAPAPVTPIANLTVMRTAADGTFTATFVVPSIATGAATVTATDATYSPTATFTVKGATGLTVSPTSAAPGATVTVTGSNFTAIAGTAVTVKLNTVTVGTFATTASGTFSGTFTVPNLPTVQYDISAVDAKVLNKTLTNGFAIAITALFPTPTSGASGTVITLTGFGFGLTGGTTFNVTLGTALIAPSVNTVAALGLGTPTITIPTIAAGSYALTVTDDKGLTASVTFTVTATSTLTVNPSQAPAAVAGIALTVRNFAAAVTVNFYITNSSYSAALATTAVVNPTNSSGIATATFTVPSIDLGAYTIVANESTGNFNATAAFSIGAATVSVSTGATTYAQGNTVSFNIQSTFASATTITVIDPTGFPVSVMTVAASLPPWVVFGSINAIPLSLVSFTLPSGAATGTYNWTVALTTITSTKTGQFTVTTSAAAGNVTNTDLNTTLANINTKLDALNTSILGIGANITSIKGTVATIQTSTGTITTSLSALDAKVTSVSGSVATLSTSMGQVTASLSSLSSSISGISSGVATIQTSLGTVTTSLSSIDAVVGLVAGDTTTLKTSVGDITTSLTSIGTTVTGISGNVATIQTDLGTLSGTVTSVTNAGIATIQTSLGTMQVSIGNLQTDVTATKDSTGSLSTLVIVAIVLALVAAMAAIASIVLMRRKIAG